MSRRKFFKESAVIGVTAMSMPLTLFSKGAVAHFGAGDIETLNRFIAVDNVCAWPNLTLLNDGTVVASIFNQPSHGRGEGDVDCWSSTDGQLWKKVGTAAMHEHMRNRMNVAAGLAKNGELIVIASGWSLKAGEEVGSAPSLVDVLRPIVSRSTDGGHTWSVNREGFPKAEGDMTELIPFGDIIVAEDGSLRVVAYAQSKDKIINKTSMYRSTDDGYSWTFYSRISNGDVESGEARGHNETAIYKVRGGAWIAAARRWKDGQAMDLFRSEDDGRSWFRSGELTEAKKHPGHLTRLESGNLLLTYGNRVEHGVAIKISSDEGKTWSEEKQLLNLDKGDVGYPSSVQMANGEIVTAYYSSGISSHNRYHMGVVIWKM